MIERVTRFTFQLIRSQSPEDRKPLNLRECSMKLTAYSDQRYALSLLILCIPTRKKRLPTDFVSCVSVTMRKSCLSRKKLIIVI